MIASYSDLLHQLMRLIDGDDVSASSIPIASLQQILELGENRLYREIQTAQNEKTWNLAVAGNAVTLPADFVSASVAHFGRAPLEPIAEAELLERNVRATGESLYFARAGGSLTFSPPAADGASLQGRYYCRLPALSEETFSANALFSAAPDLFIFAALTESAPFFGQDTRIPLWNARYTGIRDTLNEQHHRAAYSGGRIKIRPSTRLVG